MSRPQKVVLIAEDDEDDQALTADALAAAGRPPDIRFVADGEELLDYLRGEGRYALSGVDAPAPDVILLDLNMPRMSGFEVLAEVKADEALRSIPVVVLTTSRREEDVAESYRLGASSYIAKPAGFEGLVAAMTTFERYWLDLVELPDQLPR